MPLQLVLHDEERTLTFPLPEGDHLVGTAEQATIRLGHPAISRRHAAIRVRDGRATVEDLGSRNGTRVAGRRLAGAAAVEPGQGLAFGSLEGRLEEVAEGDLQAAVAFSPDPVPARDPAGGDGHATTASVGSLRLFALEAVPRLLRRLDDGAGPAEMAQEVGGALFEALPCDGVEIASCSGRDDGLLFRARSEAGVAEPAEVVAESGPYRVRVRFRHAVQARAYEPLAEAAARLVRTADRRHRTAPAPPRLEGPAEPPRPASLAAAVRAIYRDAARVARGDVGVLVTGESGTGKEVLARYLHAASPRRDRPFVALNCAALPRDLLESELFGIEDGVATGVKARPGKFELADGGTLFLDEIGDMAPETQAKILRVLQEGEVFRLGGQAARPARVRVVAATNRDLDAMLREGGFRSDLYHRIADWRVELPPLRERREDIPNLAAWFLSLEAERQGLRIGGISQAALDALVGHDWPGNVRQLEREMARAVLFVEDGQLLQTGHLQPAIREAPRAPARTLRAKIEELERRELRAAIERHEGNLSAVARDLDIGRSTLYRRLAELGLEADDGG